MNKGATIESNAFCVTFFFLLLLLLLIPGGFWTDQDFDWLVILLLGHLDVAVRAVPVVLLEPVRAAGQGPAAYVHPELVLVARQLHSSFGDLVAIGALDVLRLRSKLVKVYRRIGIVDFNATVGPNVSAKVRSTRYSLVLLLSFFLFF